MRHTDVSDRAQAEYKRLTSSAEFSGLELIASENLTSMAVMEANGSCEGHCSMLDDSPLTALPLQS